MHKGFDPQQHLLFSECVCSFILFYFILVVTILPNGLKVVSHRGFCLAFKALGTQALLIDPTLIDSYVLPQPSTTARLSPHSPLYRLHVSFILLFPAHLQSKMLPFPFSPA